MADRYWVGGTGTWNTTSTTNWSATSGGASGASVPTVSDSVFFDQASTYTVTMTGALACLDFNVTGGTVTFQNGTTPTLNVRGSWSTVAATVWNTTGAITFSATTSRTITTNAITIRSPITFNGVGGTWTLQDNVTLLSTLTTTLTAGTLALSTFTLTTGLFNSSNSNARTINFGTGKIVLNSATTSTIWTTGTTTNLTISGTPLVECIGGGTAVTKTINTGAPSEANSISFSLLDTGGTPTYAFSASNVIRNLIVNGAQTVSNINLIIYGTFTHTTVNGTTTFTAGANAWTFAATSGSYTVTNIAGFTYDFPWTFGSAASTATWTIAANLTLGATRQLSLTNGTFDFNNKTFSGAGVTIVTGTPTIANTGGPGSLSLTVPITHTSGSLTLPFNLTTTSASGYTLTAGTLTLNDFTLTAPAFSSSGSTARTLAFGTTGQLALTGNGATIFNITTATNFSTTGTVYINSTYTGSTGTRTFVTGFTEAQASAGYNVSTSGTSGIVISPSATDTVALTGNFNTIDLTGFTGTLSNTARTIYGNLVMPASGGTFAAGSSVTTFAATSGTKTITTNGRTLDFPVTINGAGGTFQLQDSLTIGATRQLTFVNGTFDFNSQAFSGEGITLTTTTFTLANTGSASLSLTVPITHSSGSLTLPFNLTTTSASGYTLTAGTLTLNNFILTTPVFSSSGSTARTLAFGTTGQLALTGNGVTIFGAADNRNLTITGTLYVNCTYTSSVGTRTILWGSSQGGTEATAQNVSFSGTTGIVLSPSATDTIALSGGFNSIDFTGFTGTLSNTARTLYGNLTVPASGGTYTAGTNVTTFGGTGTETITTNGRTLDFPITFSGVGGTFRLLDNLTVGSTRLVTLSNGTLDLNNFTLSAGQFNSSGSTARTLAFGTGQLALTGNAATIFDITTATNFSTTGTVYINSTYTGSTGTRTFVTGFTEAQAASYIVSTSGTDGIVLSPSATDIVALTGNYNNIDFTGFTGTLSNTARTIYGNLTVPASGGTFPAGASVTTFAATSGTKTITTNGRTLDFPVTISGTGGTFQLQDNFTLGSTRAFTLTAGTLALNNLTLSAATFSATGATARSVAFGTSGLISLVGNNATIVNLAIMTNFTYTGTPKIYSTYTGGTGTRTFNIGDSNAAGVTTTNIFDLSIGTSGNGLVIAAGTDAHALIGSFNIFDLTGFTGTLGNNTRFIYGSFTIPSTGGSLSAGTSVTSFVGSGSKTLSTGGRTLDFPVTIDGAGGTFQLLSNFAIGSTRAFTLTAGTLDLNEFTLSLATFSSNNGNTRSVAFGTTGKISLGGNNATIVDLSTMTNFTYTGTPKIYSTYTGATGTRTFNIGNAPSAGATSTNVFDLSIGTSGNGLVIAAGTDTLVLIGSFNDFNLTGLAQTINNNSRFIYGDFTLPASGGTLGAGVNVLSFVGVSGTKNITTNGRTLDFPITFDGAATFRLQSALLQGSTRAFTHTNGTIDLNGYTLTVGTAYTTATGTKNLTFNGGSLVCPTASATAFNNAVPGGFTTTAGTGTGTISLTAATAKTFVGNNAIYNCDIDQGGAGALTITGLNTFNRIKSSYANTTANASIILPTGSTTTLAGIVGGSASNKMLDLDSASATATAAPFRANVIISNSSIQTASYVQTNNIVFITNTANTFSANGTTPWRLYLANSINNGDTLGAVFQEYSNSAPIVYYITSGTSFTVPADWDNSNNAVHIYGAGGGSSGSYVPNSSGNRLGSAGGGGGGYTQVLNLTATPGNSLSYNIGSGGAAGSANNLSSSGGNGGNTTFAGIYTANGGGGSSITSSTTTAGTGGTGATANGGVGGLGGGAADDTDNSSGGGGGGSGGPNGAGANGGTGVVAANPSNTPGGGGGGSGGGTNGTNAVAATPGTGGNSFIGVRVGGTGGLANTFAGIIGRERGRASYDILGSIGGSGGGGGGGATGPSIRDGLNIGGGAGGSGATDSDFANPGTAGQSGGIIIVYYPSAVVSGNFSNMFLVF